MARNSTVNAILALLVAGMFMISTAGDAQAFFKAENTCLKKTAKASAKAAKSYLKQVGKCTDKVLAGKGGTLPCPQPLSKEEEKIDKAIAKARKATVKKCASQCSLTPISCIGNRFCPPKLQFPELCNNGGDFDIANIGFPGALCETGLALGAPMDDSGDIGECVGRLATNVTAPGVINGVYGSLASSDPGLTDSEADCLAAAGKATTKLVGKVAGAIFKCRDDINSGKITQFDAGDCGKDFGAGAANEKTIDKINKAVGKHSDAIGAKCADGDFLALDVCGGTATDVASAVSCLKDLAIEAADSRESTADRDYVTVTLVETAYPSLGSCGDGVVNQTPHPFLLLGEECDGAEDSACPGDCIGPGDMYECSCSNLPRVRFMADGFTADLDNGWTGSSHEGGLADGAGYFISRENCDCSAFDTVGTCDGTLVDAGLSPARQVSCTSNTDCEAVGAGKCTHLSNTCVGTSNDPLCDVGGFTLPVCDWDPYGNTRCDGHGNGNFTDEDDDCAICDINTLNPGTFCASETDCLAQCFDANGDPTGNFCDVQNTVCSGGSQTLQCQDDTDCPGSQTCLGTPCPAGQICRGQCDASRDCIEFPNGAPLPIVAGATAVCVATKHTADVTGTANIVTGAHENNVRQLSVVHLGFTNSVPCPVCGGFCNDPEGFLTNAVCQGTCSTTTTTACRFDVDCPSGETCTPATNQCGPNGSCVLSLVCNGGQNDGKTCRVEAGTNFFGTTSNDCPPSTGKNISNKGLVVNFLPSTDGTVNLPDSLPCTAPGFENFDCPCPPDGGAPTKPNQCGAVCTAAGPNYAQVCARGSSGFGSLTRCAGGTGDGEPCDEDSDCGGGTCTANPKHCDDGTFFDCTANAAICTNPLDCVDACPGGICTRLCLDTADYNALPGKPDTSTDPLGRPQDEGWCAGGVPFYKCTGEKFTFKNCPEASAKGTCNATCSTSLGPCETDDDCPVGETCVGDCEKANGCAAGIDDNTLGDANDIVGAGICQETPKACFTSPTPGVSVEATGGGDAQNVFSVSAFCIPKTTNGTINNTAGLGGPGRLRQFGLNIPNFGELDTCSSDCGDSSTCQINCPGATTPVCDCLGGGPQAQCSCQ